METTTITDKKLTLSYMFKFQSFYKSVFVITHVNSFLLTFSLQNIKNK